MNRLFITTKETYARTRPITAVVFKKGELTPKEIENYGFINTGLGAILYDGDVLTSINVNSIEEGQWLTQAIFNTLNIKEDLIINSVDKTIKIVNKEKELVIPEPQILNLNPIQSLKIEE